MVCILSVRTHHMTGELRPCKNCGSCAMRSVGFHPRLKKITDKCIEMSFIRPGLKFCGKKENIETNNYEETSIYKEVSDFLTKSFISSNSLMAMIISIIIGFFCKNFILANYGAFVKLIAICIVGLVNVYFLNKFEYKRFNNDLNIIKTY